jgi:hypothetical protein
VFKKIDECFKEANKLLDKSIELANKGENILMMVKSILDNNEVKVKTEITLNKKKV